MKRVSVFLVLILFVLVGCANDNVKGKRVTQIVWEYDNTKLKEKLKDAPIAPKLPTKMPFKVNKTTVEYQDGDIFINFDGPGKGKRGNHIVLQMAKNGGYPVLGNSIDADIGTIKGTFGESIPEMRILDWKMDDIYYHMIFLWNESDVTISKKALIETAKSFR